MVAAVRPVRGQDTHGGNALPTAGITSLAGRWATDPRPYAFSRNREAINNHQPAKIGATTCSPQCGMAGGVNGSSYSNQDAVSYTVGGTH